MKRARGFTLIELLVVMAIIAVVAAILFPVFSRAKQKAGQVKCLNNLRQIGIALGQYIADHSGGPYCPVEGDANLQHWAVTLQPYIHSEEIFRCPSSSLGGYDHGELPDAGFDISYGINQYMVASEQVDCRKIMIYPSSLAILADSASTWSGEGVLEDGTYLWQASVHHAPTLHGLGATFVFNDAHATWIPATITSGSGRGYGGDYSGVYHGAVLNWELDYDPSPQAMARPNSAAAMTTLG